MRHADLISRSKERTSSILLQQVFVLILVVILLAGCGGASITSTSGAITGRVLGDDMKPLLDSYNQEIPIVALYCDYSEIECLDASLWDMDIDVLINSICEPNDEDPACLLHFGQGAAAVEADGSYTIADVPPGEYGVVLLFPAASLRKAEYDKSVQAGKVTGVDFVLDFHSLPTVYSPIPTRLYVGPNGSLIQIPEGGTQSFVLPSNPSRVFSTNLTGDVDGDQYEFSLMLASDSITTFRVEIVVNGQVIASDEFTATSSSYERFSSKVSGIDPSTNSGDEIQLVVELLEGDRGGIGSDRIEPSYIDIPEQN
ncbi:MAG: hypothetical protein WAV05_07800 [Anaerolineales bacterium]